MPSVANNLVSVNHQALAPDGVTVVPGLSTTPGVDFRLTLQRQSGAGFVAASETVAIAEGTPGYYSMSYVPQQTGSYFLYVLELSVLTAQRNSIYSTDVLPAGAVFTPSFTQAYCAETDVENALGLAFTNTSKVTSAQAAAFAVGRAATLEAWCAYWGVTITPASIVPNSRLQNLLRDANMTGAAIDCGISWWTQVEPSENEKVRLLMAKWITLMGDGDKLKGSLQIEIEKNVAASGVRTHISSGEVLEANEQVIQDAGLSIGMSMEKVF